MDEADHGETPEKFSTASSGYCAPEPPGKTFQNAIHHTRPAIVVFSSGLRKESLAEYSKLWPKISKNGES
jgi:hypothetical protein